jgi:omega-6 fatty acid desaturase (delta-12 desaturase)
MSRAVQEQSMVHNSGDLKTQVVRAQWYKALAQFEKPDHKKAIGQILNTFVPYVGLWALMVWMVQHQVSFWLIAPLIVIAAGLVVRVFIFFHDCGHGSFFSSHKANRIVGYLCGILTFTPYEEWRHLHAEHHASAGDLDRRGIGDIKTMTVEEYLAAPWQTRLGYRLFRNPFVLFVIGPPIEFLIVHRFSHKGMGQRERTSVLLTNLGIVAMVAIASLTIGFRTYVMIQLPIIMIAGMVGVWLFYVQHQYEGVYWAHHKEWDPIRAALDGSSYFRLPKILQWFSGNIGLHHIHHLRPRIPNYNLQKCFDSVPELQAVEPLTLGSSIRCLFMNLWDEKNQRLVSFWALRHYRNQTAGQN